MLPVGPVPPVFEAQGSVRDSVLGQREKDLNLGRYSEGIEA